MPKASFIVSLAEIVNVVMEEHKTYPFTAFLSDTGGAAGLFLGLNIIGKAWYILDQFGSKYGTERCKNLHWYLE